MKHKSTQPYLARSLGIDPGLAHTGYAVLESYARGGKLCCWGSIKTTSHTPHPERLQKVYQHIDSLIKKWLPKVIAIEDVFVLDRFPKAAIQLGEVRGVICLAAQDNGVQISRIRPTEVKYCLTGNGRATKQQVGRAVRRMLGAEEEIKPDHASDAAAMALVGLSRADLFVFSP